MQSFSRKNYLLYGLHPCIEALKNSNRKIIKIFCTKEIFEKFGALIKPFPHEVTLSKSLIAVLKKDVNHQGIVVQTEPIMYDSIHKINLTLKPNKIVILDQITDPQNVGAIIRSAVAFGFTTIISPIDGGCSENDIVAKAACGGLEKINYVQVVNLSSCIDFLKEKGFWIVGLDIEKAEIFSEKMRDAKLAVVLGSEGKGMRRLTREKCDFIVKIPISSNIESLNVSNAASIIFYEISKGEV